ncbi:TPA: hypothetical protein MFX25_01075 [Klebsiella pneumoniae]|nr:hypothetical protein [Klebsiella pneumoniae]HBW9740935.1 hypothetical protein [Klebsiella pneumoniae]HBY0993128.1 hypothetical protein [Klebsiella pneumoniae]
MPNDKKQNINDIDSVVINQASDAMNDLSVEVTKINTPEKFCENYDDIVKILNKAIEYSEKVPFPVVVKTVIALKALREVLAIIHSGFCPVKG